MYSAASTATVQPTDRAASVVTGLKLASRISRPMRPRASGGNSSCSRAVMAGLVSVIQSIVPAMIRSTTDSGNARGVGIVVDGNLVDFGQLFELVLEDCPSAIGASKQDPLPPDACWSSAAASASERNVSGTRSAFR